MLRTAWSRLLDLFTRDRRERRLDAEIQTHIDFLIEEHIARGLSPGDARLAARKAFGGVDQMKERYRDQRGLPAIEMLIQDVRFACRLMRKNAAFSLTAGGSLALSIGALTLAFAIVNAFVFKPLPISDPDRVYFMQNGSVGWSYPDFRDLQERLDVDALAGYRISMMNVGLDPSPQILWGYLATGAYFQALGVSPAAGRLFTAEEDVGRGAAPLVVLAYDTWQSRFGGKQSVIGSTLTINGLPFTIVGVAPPGFHGTEVLYRPELWVPMSMQAEIELGSTWLDHRETQNVMAVVRVRQHVTRSQTEAAIAAVVSQLNGEHRRNGPLQLRLARPGMFGDGLGAPARAFSWGLFTLGALLMLVGCSNLAGLLLARGNDRAREIALRSALGASKTRIARQLLTESVLLASTGGIGGAFLAWASTRAISSWRLPIELPIQLDLTADGTVVLFAIAVAIVVGLIVGIAPARFATRLDLTRSVKSAGGVVVNGRRIHGRELLVGLQVALCVVLLHASLLAVFGLHRAATASIGWKPDGIVMAATELGLARYDRAQAEDYWRRAIEEARALPGVVSATASNSMPLHLDQSSTTAFAYPASELELGLSATYYRVLPNFFATLGITLREGRDFNDFDDASSPPVAIVNRAFAERLFGTEAAVGRQFREGRGGEPTEIIGVIEDGKYAAVAEARRAALFRPLRQRFATQSMLIIRASTPGAVRTEDLRQIIRRIDPALPIRTSATGEQITAFPLLPYRATAMALGLLGVIASGLMLSGLYAMVAYAVARRQREIGIRRALGATNAGVAGVVLSRVVSIVSSGTALGALLSSGTGPLLSSMMLAVSPWEPAVVGVIALVLASIALLSCAGPIRRSMRVDPLVALREE